MPWVVMRGARSAFSSGLVEQPLELVVGGGVVYVVGQRTEHVEQGRADVELAGVDDHRGEAMLPGGAAGGDHSAKGATDQHDPLGVDLGLGRERIEHLGHDVFPVRTHRHPLVVEHRALTGSVDRGERVTAIERRRCRGVQLLGGSVVAVDVQDRRMRTCAGRSEQVARHRAGQHPTRVLE